MTSMASSFPTLLLFSLFLLYQPLSSTANLHKTKLFRSQILSEDQPQDTPYTTYFEVTKPIKLPKTKPCSTLVLQHDFGSTYGKPPVTSPYNPPTDCPSQNFSKIVLEWKSTCIGRQFDRIFGVWLGGVELLRSCSAEPRATGTIWTVQKDITRYLSLLKDPQLLAVFLGNIVDKTYTGVYHVNITIHFYPSEPHKHSFRFKGNHAKLGSGVGFPADLIIPISRNLPLDAGLWFEVKNSTSIEVKEFSIPRNAYKAVLEVYVSPHENDEFWYGNAPNDYILANNLTDDMPGNGPFREVVVSLDGKVVGAVWPFTVIYTGGVNPLLWRPITAIGSFDLPSYDIEITPFLSKILDGEKHMFGFEVTNALNVWYIDANLHVWLDSKSTETKAGLIQYKSPALAFSSVSDFKGMNGTFLTRASRSIYSSGWVESSRGRIMTDSFQSFSFMNSMEMGENGELQIVSQTIHANHTVHAKLQSSSLYTIGRFQKFPLYMYTTTVDQGDGSSNSLANISLAFNEETFLGHGQFGFLTSSLKNEQGGQSQMIVKKNLVQSGLGSTQQAYKYEGVGGCYFRNVSSTNYTIHYDKSGNHCDKRKWFGLDYQFGGWRPFHARRAFLASDLHYGNTRI